MQSEENMLQNLGNTKHVQWQPGYLVIAAMRLFRSSRVSRNYFLWKRIVLVSLPLGVSSANSKSLELQDAELYECA